MKNGFTLIELLAVIVILAVLALIATPVVLSIIDDAKESAMLRSAEMYLSGVENAVMRENMNSGGNFRPNECTITSEGNIYCDGNEDIIEIEVNGETPSNGNIVFENGKIIEVSLTYKSGTIVKDESGSLVYSEETSLTYALLDNWQHQLSDGTIETHVDSDINGICDLCNEDEIPGLYHPDGTFVSWEQLTSMEYQTLGYWACVGYDEEGEDVYEEFYYAILNVDSNGVLRTAYDLSGMDPSSSIEYLNGKLVISNEVSSFYKHIFSECEYLTEVIIPNTITSIERRSFNSCYNLTSITIPESVTNIDIEAFYACYKLISIIVDNNNPVYDSRNNCNAIIETATDTLIKGCNTTKIPVGIKAIEFRAFDHCENLTSISIPDTVEKIGLEAFVGCKALKTIYIPSSVKIMSTSYTHYYENGSGTSNGVGPFNSCSKDLKIYCGVSSKQSGWGTKWNYYSSSNGLSVEYGVTREEYETIINNA